jgi:hypothetical protein
MVHVVADGLLQNFEVVDRDGEYVRTEWGALTESLQNSLKGKEL